MQDNRKSLESLILAGKNIVLGKQGCKYCDMAVKLLITKNIKFTYIEYSECEDYIRAFEKARGKITYPQVFINGTRIGGFTDLEKLIKYDFFIIENFVHEESN